MVHKLFKSNQSSEKQKLQEMQHTATFVTKNSGDLFDCFTNENQLILELWESVDSDHSHRFCGFCFLCLFLVVLAERAFTIFQVPCIKHDAAFCVNKNAQF